MKFLEFLSSLLSKRTNAKPFAAWQIELTTRCPLRCKMCIRAGIEEWKIMDMEFEHFLRLKPYFKRVERVVLEGCGESLLSNYIIEAIKLIKSEGAQAGFVTCGKPLTEDFILRLALCGLDFLGFSFSGATSKTHNAIRINSDLQSLISKIVTFNRVKKELKKSTPHIHMVFLMLKDNIHEIPELLKLAKEIDIKP